MRVMGVDLGIAKVAFSVWEDDILTETWAKDFSGLEHRASQLSWMTTEGSAALVTRRPDHVFIEDVLIGNNRKYSIRLGEAKGAMLAGMGMALSATEWIEDMPLPHIYTVNVRTWKKEVLGRGNATKLEIKNYLLQRDSAYAELCDGDQDQFDAACIGYYGIIVANRAEKLSVIP